MGKTSIIPTESQETTHFSNCFRGRPVSDFLDLTQVGPNPLPGNNVAQELNTCAEQETLTGLQPQSCLQEAVKDQLCHFRYGAKHPVQLGKHHLTELLLEKTHVERMHQGVEGVLSYICQNLWIIGGRRGLRNITQRCVICRRYKAKAASEVCPPLPDRHWRIILEKVADFARKAVKLAEPYNPYGGQLLEFCSISLSTYQTCMKLTRKSTEFANFSTGIIRICILSEDRVVHERSVATTGVSYRSKA